MPCNQWYRLVESYKDAVHSYSDAARALSVLAGPAFNETWQRVEHARTESENCRADVLHHEHQHACLESEPANRHPELAAVSSESLVLGDQGQSGG
jgi:hypothetical protein